MRRREFMALAGVTTMAWSLAARAQQSEMPVIGFIHSGSSSDVEEMTAAFSQGLREIGYIEGQNVAIEYRWAEGRYERLPRLITELIAHRVAVIFAGGGTAPAATAKAATSTIPIVFVSATDPVKADLVGSLSQPGGNVTGVSMLGSTLEAKKLGLLHELVPGTSTIAALINTNYPDAKSELNEIEAAANHIGVQLVALTVNAADDIDAAFATIVQRSVGALLVAQAPLFAVRREQIIALAARYSVPTIYFLREFVAAGGLISYGAHFADGYRQAGIYVGRILKGEKPANLPIVQPTKLGWSST